MTSVLCCKVFLTYIIGCIHKVSLIAIIFLRLESFIYTIFVKTSHLCVMFFGGNNQIPSNVERMYRVMSKFVIPQEELMEWCFKYTWFMKESCMNILYMVLFWALLCILQLERITCDSFEVDFINHVGHKIND